MHFKTTYLVQVWDERNPEIKGIGEIALFEGLSAEDNDVFDVLMRRSLENIDSFDSSRCMESSVIFGIESALANLRNSLPGIYFTSAFTREEKAVTINGLIWMGTFKEMRDRINEKLKEGFQCIKLKIGGLNFFDELELVRWMRARFPASDLTIRLDANGSFSRCRYEVAEELLGKLASYDIHSIEQPFRAADFVLTKRICSKNIIPIALDEQLIGVTGDTTKGELLDYLKPQYIVLKPSLCGGFGHTDKWIEKANERGIGWWITSALESAVGLNAIAQWVGCKDTDMPQGLGTGELFTNDIISPIVRNGENLYFDESRCSDMTYLDTLPWIYV